MLLIALSLGISANAQDTQDEDSTKVKGRSAFSRNLGFGFGISYSFLQLESSPYILVDSTGITGQSEVQNGLGFSGCLYYSIPITEKFLLRPGIEGHILRSRILYDNNQPNRQRTEAFPVTAEIPIAAVWMLPYGNSDEEGMRSSINVVLAARPVIAIPKAMGLYPAQKQANFNIDAGIGIPFSVSKLKFTMEAIFSYGLLNIIGTNENDFHTSSVSYLGRHFAGLRFYFN